MFRISLLFSCLGIFLKSGSYPKLLMKGNSPGEGRGGAAPAPSPWESSFALKHMNQTVLLEETGMFYSSLAFRKALSGC